MLSRSKVLLNIVTVGDSKTGKTSLLSALKDGQIPQNSSIPDIFDTFMHNIKVDGQKVQLGLWDTTGEEKYEALRRLSYPNCDVFVVCYSVNSRKSFDNVKSIWLPEVKKYGPITPVVIVGTKIDMRPHPTLTRNLSSVDTTPAPTLVDRFVQFHEGLTLANQVGASAFVECSALKASGVKEVFERAAKVVLQNSEEQKSPKDKNPKRKGSGGFISLLKHG